MTIRLWLGCIAAAVAAVSGWGWLSAQPGWKAPEGAAAHRMPLASSLLSARYGHSSVAVGPSLYVLGGQDRHFGLLDSIERLSLPGPRGKR